jgi:hypothetical protein
MPPLDELARPVWSTARKVGVLTLRGYLVVAVLLVLGKVVQLALTGTGHGWRGGWGGGRGGAARAPATPGIGRCEPAARGMRVHACLVGMNGSPTSVGVLVAIVAGAAWLLIGSSRGHR